MILIHGENELADAININPYFSMLKWRKKTMVMKNRHFSKTTTKSKPCQKYWPKTCQNLHTQKKIAQTYNCTLPIFFPGHHLIQKEIMKREVDSHLVNPFDLFL